MKVPRSFIFLFASLLHVAHPTQCFLSASSTRCWLVPTTTASTRTPSHWSRGGGGGSGGAASVSPTTAVGMARNAKLKKKKSSSTGGAAGLKGFGGSSSSSSSASTSFGKTIVDRSPSALKFYDHLERNGGGTNLKRVGLGNSPLLLPAVGPPTEEESDDVVIQLLRGVVALRDIPKGETILEIPYEMALDLGRERADPTLPATTLLQAYCTWRTSSDSSGGSRGGGMDRGDYFAMLPPYLSDDCSSSTDFFGDGALEMLQSPAVVEETLMRRELVKLRFERDVEPMSRLSSNLYRWNAEEIATQSHLRWAMWIITSRVLTVQGAPESSSSSAHRLLIPLIDMCNHDRDSPHILTGRAMPGGLLKVVAGADVVAGEAINIGYGGGVEGNDRFIQDYGFLDNGGSKERGKRGGENKEFVAEGYKIVAKKLLGKGSTRSISKITAGETERALEELKLTSLAEDEKLLASGTIVKSDERMALEYRIGVKKALREYGS